MADSFSGTWQFTHWYPNTDDSEEQSASYQVVAHQNGKDVVFQSEPDEREAYTIVRLTIDGPLATGSWHENADMHGPFEGVQYSGAGQLLISEDGNRMEGMWAGAGLDRAAGEPKIYTGRWELKRLS